MSSQDPVSPQPTRMPVLFAGHGSPMNAVEDNEWSRALRALAPRLPRPRAILCVSAHWFVPGTRLTADEHPRTIHDFSGFPPELFAVSYPAPGDAPLARRVAERLAPWRASLSTDWGLDHGAWTVLLHLRPAADVPVVQLSVDQDLAAEGHLGIGRALRPLRDEGVLLLASGNVVHNLGHALSSARRGHLSTPGWARAFDAEVERASTAHDGEALARALASADGRASHPTPDHYLPLLYAAGAADERDPVSFPVTGFDLGSLSMRTVLFG
jgi:4,5-DOPA dioxygenase extradiol